MTFNPKPLILRSDKIELQPMQLHHVEAFYLAGADPELWRWSLPNRCLNKATANDWIVSSLAKQQAGEHVPFVIIDRLSQQLVGSTRYCNIHRDDRNLEIGFTFINGKFQRTYVNTHTKFLLLQHAFESLRAIRVEFKTHEKNTTSRAAIARIGGVFEGILRQQRILPDGSYRNTALFSIIDSEWPTVKQRLQQKMVN